MKYCTFAKGEKGRYYYIQLAPKNMTFEELQQRIADCYQKSGTQHHYKEVDDEMYEILDELIDPTKERLDVTGITGLTKKLRALRKSAQNASEYAASVLDGMGDDITDILDQIEDTEEEQKND